MSQTDQHEIERPFYVHQWLDAQDSYKHWYEAQIVQIDPDRNSIKVHYKGWKSKFDEWINFETDSDRIATLHTFTTRPPHIGSVDLSVGLSLDVKDSTDKWYEGEVMDLNERLVRIHYKGWGSKFDEWINRDSYRLAPLHSTTKPGSSTKKKTNSNNNSRTGRGTQGRNNNSHNSSSSSSHTQSPRRTFDSDQTINVQGQLRNDPAFQATPRNEANFREIIRAKHWEIEDMGDDGNCLFRSISHQIYGTQDYHHIVRLKCVEYLQEEAAYFSNFVEGDEEDFFRYCEHMKRNAVWGGNIEIQAFSEMYQRRIEIYAYSDRPMKTFSNEHVSTIALMGATPSQIPIRLSYHFNSHYNSIIEPRKHRLYTLSSPPGELEDERIRMSRLRSRDALESTQILSDIEATNLELFKDTLTESRRLFEASQQNYDQAQFDEVLAQSLTDFNESTLQRGIDASLQDQEVNQIVQHMEQEEYKQALAASLAEAWPRPVQALVSQGFSLEEALQAHTIFEDQTSFSEDEIVEKMRDYLLALRHSAALEWQG